MIYIDKQSIDPYFNIAAEEVALKSRSEDILMLWINNPSVVVGKHQNTIAEVNQRFTWENNIPVIRRLSGGGTVFHDGGNLNYSIISTVENKERSIDFQKFTDPIIEFLVKFGIHASFLGKTNLGVNGKKISGNAAHIFKNRVVHHGTLLFNSNLNNLEDSIRPSGANVEDKSIKSVRANIINLIELMPQIQSINDFQDQLKQFLYRYFNISQSSIFSNEEIKEIEQLVKNKYNTSEWTYGYSPTYNYNKSISFKGEETTAWFEVKKGIIVDLRLDSKNIPKESINFIQNTIVNSHHNPYALNEILKRTENTINHIGMESSFLFNLFF